MGSLGAVDCARTARRRAQLAALSVALDATRRELASAVREREAFAAAAHTQRLQNDALAYHNSFLVSRVSALRCAVEQSMPQAPQPRPPLPGELVTELERLIAENERLSSLLADARAAAESSRVDLNNSTRALQSDLVIANDRIATLEPLVLDREHLHDELMALHAKADSLQVHIQLQDSIFAKQSIAAKMELEAWSRTAATICDDPNLAEIAETVDKHARDMLHASLTSLVSVTCYFINSCLKHHAIKLDSVSTSRFLSMATNFEETHAIAHNFNPLTPVNSSDYFFSNFQSGIPLLESFMDLVKLHGCQASEMARFTRELAKSETHISLGLAKAALAEYVECCCRLCGEQNQVTNFNSLLICTQKLVEILEYFDSKAQARKTEETKAGTAAACFQFVQVAHTRRAMLQFLSRGLKEGNFRCRNVSTRSTQTLSRGTDSQEATKSTQTTIRRVRDACEAPSHKDWDSGGLISRWTQTNALPRAWDTLLERLCESPSSVSPDQVVPLQVVEVACSCSCAINEKPQLEEMQRNLQEMMSQLVLSEARANGSEINERRKEELLREVNALRELLRSKVDAHAIEMDDMREREEILDASYKKQLAVMAEELCRLNDSNPESSQS